MCRREQISKERGRGCRTHSLGLQGRKVSLRRWGGSKITGEGYSKHSRCKGPGVALCLVYSLRNIKKTQTHLLPFSGLLQKPHLVPPASSFSLSEPRLLDARWVLCSVLGARVGKLTQGVPLWRLQSSPDIENGWLMDSP